MIRKGKTTRCVIVYSTGKPDCFINLSSACKHFKLKYDYVRQVIVRDGEYKSKGIHIIRADFHKYHRVYAPGYNTHKGKRDKLM